MSDYSDFIGFLTNRKEAAVTPESQPELTLLERAKELRLKHASHNQASHGFRFGKTPSLGQARRYRKSGVLQEYLGRARKRSGTKPAVERARDRAIAERPKKEPKKKSNRMIEGSGQKKFLSESGMKKIADSKGTYEIKLGRGGTADRPFHTMTVRTNSAIAKAKNNWGGPQFSKKTGRIAYIRSSGGAGGDYGAFDMVDLVRGMQELQQKGYWVSGFQELANE